MAITVRSGTEIGDDSRGLTTVNVPLSLEEAMVEYEAFSDGVAVFEDVGRGKVKAVGADVLDLVNRLSTNKVDPLAVGQGAPTIFTSEKGRTIDLVYVFNLGRYVLIVTGAGAERKVMEWVDRYTFIEDSELEDVTDSMALLTLVGPEVGAVLEGLTGLSLEGIEPYQSLRFDGDGLGGWVVQVPFGEHVGYWVLVENDGKSELMGRLAVEGGTRVSKESWETFRVGAGIPVYGKELNEDRNPLESGLIGAIDFTKGCYIGQEVIARLDTYEKVQRTLVALKVGGGRSPLPW